VLRRNWELWLALIAIAAITAAYVSLSRRTGSPPPASGLLGHGLGVLGFVLMLMTQTLYSFRKRSTRARWGSMAVWLKFHMFTGLVGAYLVLLHPAMKFTGLAGVVALMTVVVVASGLVGRYLYTAVPRTVEGAEFEMTELEAQIAQGQLVLMVAGDRGRPPELQALAGRRRVLRRQMDALAAARRGLATWRAVHIPLTVALFLLAFVHGIGALYYVTLPR
jgi:hypothetical protein